MAVIADSVGIRIDKKVADTIAVLIRVAVIVADAVAVLVKKAVIPAYAVIVRIGKALCHIAAADAAIRLHFGSLDGKKHGKCHPAGNS